MSTYPSQYPPPGAQRKTSPLVWILAILGVFVMLVIVAVAGIGLFVAHKVKEAGVDSDSMKRNPALATIKVMAALNPNIEIVTLDEDKGFVTVRDKKSGRTFKVTFDDAKRGKFTMQEEGKDPVTITTRGDFNVPTWIPDYPHSTPQGSFATEFSTGDSGNFTFKTKDSVSKVLSYYEDGFRSEGMEIEHKPGNVISAKRGQKSAVVMVGTGDGDSSVSVTFEAKK